LLHFPTFDDGGEDRMADFIRFINRQAARAVRVFLHPKVSAARGLVAYRRVLGQDPRLEEAQLQIAEQDRELARLRAKLRTTRSARETHQSPPVFFVVGRYKSGTSWLTRTLNSHPEILCRGEGRFFGREWERGDLTHRDWTMEDLRQEKIGIPPRSLYGALFSAAFLRLWLERTVWSRDQDPEEHLIWITRAITAYLLDQKLAESGKKIVGDKTPFLTADSVKEMGRIYPEAKVIHIIRDGRDVTVSATHHRWNRAKDQGGRVVLGREEMKLREAYRKNPQGLQRKGIITEQAVEAQAKTWRDMVTRARQDGPALPGNNYTEVRYEDLLGRPEEELGRLLRFLGVGAEREIVNYCVDAASFEKLSKGRQRGQEDPNSFFRKGIAGDWKNVFTERDRQIFKEAAGDLLIELGYEKDNDW